MDVIELTPRLHFIRLPIGHACLWSDPDGLTLIDASLPGSAPLIADAIRRAGSEPAELRRLVLTHFHPDHIGSASGIAGWGGVEVLAGWPTSTSRSRASATASRSPRAPLPRSRAAAE